jgi:ATP-binding cassette subfamily B protein
VKGAFARLFRYSLRYRGRVAITLAASIVSMAALVATPLIMRGIIDTAILTHQHPIAPYAAALLTAAVVNYAGSYMRRYWGGRLSLDVQRDLRDDVYVALSRLDGRRQDDLSTGQVISRSTSDITIVQGLLALVPVNIGNLLLFLFSLGVMLTLSPLLTVVALAVGPALWFVAARSRGRLFPATWEAQQQSSAVAGMVNDAVTGVRVVKGFGQEEQELTKLEVAAHRLYASRLRAVRLTSRYNPVLQTIPPLGQVGILLLGGLLAIRGDITIGTFLAFSYYLAQLVGPVRMLSNLLTIGQQAQASIGRVFELVDTAPEVTESPGATALDADGQVGVEFCDLTFGHPDGPPVLRGLNLAIRPGETVAVVGGAGSGKTTLALLLARFYDPDAGTVRLAGRDLRDLTLESVRETVGLVMEDSFLFSETIRDNIAYGRPDAPQDEIEQAAKAAQAHEFVLELPQGYDTVVGEQGLTLSGGQRQRVALARALLAEPRVLVLDDATSAVDARIEAEIHAALQLVAGERTTLLIAHRHSTLTLADRIAVLNEGRVIDLGTHDELIARCEHYRLLLTGPDLSTIDIPADEEETTPGGVTPHLWPRVDEPDPLDDHGPANPLAGGVPTPGAGAAFGGRTLARGGGGGGVVTGALAGVPPSPELLAAVAALPPARGEPDVDEAAVRAPAPRFNLGTLIRPFTLALTGSVVLVALDALATIVLPALTRNGIDRGIQIGDAGVVVTVALLGLVVVLTDLLLTTWQIRLAGRTGERLLYTLRMKSFAHLQRLGLDYYERELSGRIMTRMTTDIDAFSTFLQTGLTTALVAGLTFVGVLVALLVVNLNLGLVVLTTLPVMLVATWMFRSRSAQAYAQAREQLSYAYAYLQENVTGMRVVQANRREAHNRQAYAKLCNAFRDTRVRAQGYLSVYFPFVQLLSTVAAALTLTVGSRMIDAHTLSPGDLVAYLLYIDLFFSPIQQLSQVFDGYQQAAVGLNRIADLLRTPTSTPDAVAPTAIEGRLRGHIHFDEVRFRYAPDAPEALRGVDLTIAPGETVALVGETGAGKSTMVKLIARFYDVTDGAVLVDEQDVRHLDLAGYRHRLGLVPQDAFLFPGTIRDTIAYGRPDATDGQVEAAARAVGAHEMIARLPHGYLSRVAERGRNLSNGQRQLLALARAELVDPDILLMDEATAALDLATEATVTRAAARLAKRRTTIVVAHRLTTAARADRIAVVHNGQLVEIGPHAELLEADGRYAQLWRVFTRDHLHEDAGVI